jgi:hypothetical protein
MNTKNTAVALIVALSYEVLVKLCRTFTPSVFEHPTVAAILSMLSFLVGIVLILFLLFFYQENRSNRRLAGVSFSLVACFALRFVLRLPVLRGLMGFQANRFLEEAIGFITAVLLFLFILWYRSGLAPGWKPLKRAAGILATLLGVALVPHAYSLVLFVLFMSSGIPTDFPPAIYQIMLLLFILTHASAIYFLYRYARFEATPQA